VCVCMCVCALPESNAYPTPVIHPLFPPVLPRAWVPAQVVDRFRKLSRSTNFNFPQIPGTGFAHMLAHASRDAVDLVGKLIAYDPEERCVHASAPPCLFLFCDLFRRIDHKGHHPPSPPPHTLHFANDAVRVSSAHLIAPALASCVSACACVDVGAALPRMPLSRTPGLRTCAMQRGVSGRRGQRPRPLLRRPARLLRHPPPPPPAPCCRTRAVARAAPQARHSWLWWRWWGPIGWQQRWRQPAMRQQLQGRSVPGARLTRRLTSTLAAAAAAVVVRLAAALRIEIRFMPAMQCKRWARRKVRAVVVCPRGQRPPHLLSLLLPPPLGVQLMLPCTAA
jgi:hypothetical protein